MAAEKSPKPKRKSSKPAPAASAGGRRPDAARADEGKNLRRMNDPRSERRYEPAASAFAIATVLLFSLGAVALGAGVYAQWLRGGDVGPHPWALYFLVTGAVLLLAVALFGQTTARPVRVGDGGVAIERDDSIERIAWCDVSRLLVTDDVVTVQGEGMTISVPRKVHPQAAARVVREAKDRIPKKVDAEVSVPAPEGAVEPANEPLDPPQIAGRTCKGSGELVSFEKDARFCGRCGELYHKNAVPDRCLTCDARLK